VSTSTTYTPWSQVEAAAMAYAARLDVLLAETRDEALENALLAVGDLLGGLSIHGFAGDLRMHLERVEADLLEDAPRHEYNPGMGGNDPSQCLSSRLEDMIHQARADDCADWLDSAQAALAQRQPLAEAA
jgi:hypothetical protein